MSDLSDNNLRDAALSDDPTLAGLAAECLRLRQKVRDQAAHAQHLEDKYLAVAGDVKAKRARVAGLEAALQAMFDCYEGVDDLAAPTIHRSEEAKQADALACAALAAEGAKETT